MDMMKNLNINIKDSFISECWTFYKSCILGSYSDGQKWMSTHMEVNLDGGCGSFWGNGVYYPLDYYDGILRIAPGDINKITPEKLINYIKRKIDSNVYILIDSDYSIIYHNEESGARLHEILIFGYDDEEEVFLCPMIDRQIAKVPFAFMKSSYEEIREIYLNDPKHRYNRRIAYFFPITEIKKRKLSMNKDEFLFSCLRKIQDELKGEKSTIEKINPEEPSGDPRYVFKGLSMLSNLDEFLSTHIKNETATDKLPIDLTLTLLNLYEHRINLSNCLKCVVETFDTNCKLKNLYDNYVLELQNIQKAYLISYKSILNNIPHKLTAIRDAVKDNMFTERHILADFLAESEKQIEEKYLKHC